MSNEIPTVIDEIAFVIARAERDGRYMDARVKEMRFLIEPSEMAKAHRRLDEIQKKLEDDMREENSIKRRLALWARR